jgi:hypothetical protein
VATDRKTQWITFHVPEDPALLEALGCVTVRHGHLDHVLRMVIKTLTETSVSDALAATKRVSSASLRDRIKKLAKAKLGDGPALVQLQALLERAKQVTDRRNELIHSLYAKHVEGDEAELMQNEHNSWVPLPTVEVLRALDQEIKTLLQEVNLERLNGFINAALEARKQEQS